MIFDLQQSLTRALACLPSLARSLLLLSAAALFLLFFLQPATFAAQEPVLPPTTTPDAAEGLQIYAARCANCHGPRGMGDGELAAQLPQPPAPLADQDYLRQAVPSRMFEVITHGVVERGMPPFGPASSDPLSEAQRWNLVAALYSLGTDSARLEAGQTVYEQNCLACHGIQGQSGEADFSQPATWFERSNQAVVSDLTRSELEEHRQLDLGDEELLAAVNYARSFSYSYVDPAAAFAPIEAAHIGGTVINQSTDSELPAGTAVELTGFTADFEPSLTMTTTLNEAGEYNFDLAMVPPDLRYVVTVEYDGISYGSEFGRLERDNPALTLPVPVYERTTDDSAVRIGQLHIILEFAENQLQVSELYQFSHDAPAVFVGESGDPATGTVRLTLPEGASAPTFNRSFGGVDSFFAAEDLIQTEEGWADTVPLRPGQDTLSLLARYTLPYQQNALTFSHPVHYPVGSVNVILPDTGVELSGSQQWQAQEPQVMGEAGVFLNYTASNVARGERLTFALQGTPRQVTSSAGRVALRDQTGELLIGSAALLLALALGGYTIRHWQQNQSSLATGLGEEAGEDAAGQTGAGPKEELLYAIALLDDAFEEGQLPQAEYEQRRRELKAELRALWDQPPE